MKILFKKILRKLADVFGGDNDIYPPSYFEKLITLESLALAKTSRSVVDIKNLQEVEFSGFSQWGEDGIIDWLIEKLPGIPETFVEFGVGDYQESNTRLLLYLRNWKGLVIDGSSENIDKIQSHEIYWRYDLTAKQAFITRDNINTLISSSGFNDDIGLLSVDIDGNDYWVWKAIDSIRPYIVVCEYNAVFGDLHSITVPYDETFNRTDKHHSNLYFGASIKSLINLAESKGYTFIGTCRNGCNAFFVDNKNASSLIADIEGYIAHNSKVRESRDATSSLTFLSGTARVDDIINMMVFDTETQSEKPLSDYDELYSDKWKVD